MYIIIFLFSVLGLYSMSYISTIYKSDYVILKNNYNKLHSDFLQYQISNESTDKSYKNRLVNLRLEYAQLKVNYKQLLNENISLREENLDLKEDLKNWNNNDSPVIV